MNNKITNKGSEGGLLEGPSHAKGGIPVVVKSTGEAIEVEGGEIIINKKASEIHCEELSKINQSAGNGIEIPCKSNSWNSKTAKLGTKVQKKEKIFIGVPEIRGYPFKWYEQKAQYDNSKPKIINYADRNKPLPKEKPKKVVREEGIDYFKGEISIDKWVDCLLYKNKYGEIIGILNHYPFDFTQERKGNINIFVAPNEQGKGIGLKLIKEALKRYPDIDLYQQEWTPQGQSLLRKIGADKNYYKFFQEYQNDLAEAKIKKYTKKLKSLDLDQSDIDNSTYDEKKDIITFVTEFNGMTQSRKITGTELMACKKNTMDFLKKSTLVKKAEHGIHTSATQLNLTSNKMDYKEELKQAQSDLHKAEHMQEMMKQANTILRGKDTNEHKIQRLVEAGWNEDQAKKVLSPDFMGRTGFPQYKLTNNNSLIKRLNEKVKKLEVNLKGSKSETEERYVFEGGEIFVNYEINRVQVLFPNGRTDKETFQKLRRSGFVYSPTNKAFQRQINPIAIRTAVSLFDARKIDETELDKGIDVVFDARKIDETNLEQVEDKKSNEFDFKNKTLDEFSNEVYNEGYDFEMLGIDKKKIQSLVKNYHATTDAENKEIAKNRIDQAISQNYGANHFLAQRVQGKSETELSPKDSWTKKQAYDKIYDIITNNAKEQNWIGTQTKEVAIRNQIWNEIQKDTTSNVYSNEDKVNAMNEIYNQVFNAQRQKEYSYDKDLAKKYVKILNINPEDFNKKFGVKKFNVNDYLRASFTFKDDNEAEIDLTLNLTRTDLYGQSRRDTYKRTDDIVYWLRNAVQYLDDQPDLILANLKTTNREWTSHPKNYIKGQETEDQNYYDKLEVVEGSQNELEMYKNILNNIEKYPKYNKKNVEQIIAELESKMQTLKPVNFEPIKQVTGLIGAIDVMASKSDLEKIKKSIENPIIKNEPIRQATIRTNQAPINTNKNMSDYQKERERQISTGEITPETEGISIYALSKEVNKPKVVEAPIVEQSNVDRLKIINAEYKNQYLLNKAIESFVKIVGENTNDYTSDEKAFIKKYSGYGGLSKYGPGGKGAFFEFYTPVPVIRKMWALAYKYGYSGGDILEPSVGTGEFLAFAPPKSNITGFEISEHSATICRILYSEANIITAEFEKQFIGKNNFTIKDMVEPKYDLVIGNPPYGSFDIVKSRYMNMGEDKWVQAKNYAEYFIRRGLDLLKPNGLMVIIVGASIEGGGHLLLDSENSPVKEYLTKNCELLDAYRLPDAVFERTGVTSEIIVLQKKG